MNLHEIVQHRLTNQRVSQPELSSPDELVSWMGAMQAQDYEMAKWALGLRIPGSTRKTIERAIQNGDILRTHLLRPTWHFVSADDLDWILDITAPRIRIAMRSRKKQLGLTEEVISKSNRVIEEALKENDHMTRSELVQILENAGFENEDNRASHLLINAELDKVICSGPSEGKEYTYALFEERVPTGEQLSTDEALAKLAEIYFNSHGPATLEDFMWWSGLTKTQAKKALEMIEPDFLSEEIDSQTYWFSDSVSFPQGSNESVYLIPAYDEFLVSYKDRSAAIKLETQKKVISNNGIFRPIIVIDGEVVGIWKRSEQKGNVSVDTQFFANSSKKIILQVEEAAEKFAEFLGKDLKINHIVAS